MALPFAQYFLNVPGLWALLALIPFIAVWLIRPRSVRQPIPSLMFLVRDEKTHNTRALFRTFFANTLFFIELLAILAIAFAIASPVLTLPGAAQAQHTIVVIDASASMKTQDGAQTRFAEAVSQAKSHLEGKITLIEAEHAPFLLMDQGSQQQAQSILSALTPHDTTSNIGEAILLAGDYAQKGSQVVVISDFAQTSGIEPLVAAQTLRARGIPVQLIPVGSPQPNLAFVNLVLDKSDTKAYVKNYYDTQKSVTVSYLSGDKKTTKQTRTILPNSIEIFDFPTTQGVNKLTIDAQDPLPADNVLYTSVPDLKKIKVLLISSIDADKDTSVKTCSQLATRLRTLTDQKKLTEQYSLVKLLTAFSAVGTITCDYRFPPLLPDEKTLEQYDIIILYKFNQGEITPVSYHNLLAAAQHGSHLIITADRSISSSAVAPLLPVTVGGTRDVNATISYARTALTLNVNFDATDVRRIVQATAHNNSEVIASAAGSTLIARAPLGAGDTTYYGLLEDYTDFASTPDYVVFFGQLFDQLTSSVDLKDYNFPTGTIAVDGQDTKLLEDIGAYTVGSKTVAANLLSDAESNTMNVPKVTADAGLQSQLNQSQTHQEKLWTQLCVAALALLLLELIYLKWRGDI